jgi:tetrahydrofolate dehydrogenase/cyclohydrolase-like protein
LACVPPIFHGRHCVAAFIDSRLLAGEVKGEVRRTIEVAMACGGHRPGLAVAKVGDEPASAVYVRGKRRACEEVGILSATICRHRPPCPAHVGDAPSIPWRLPRETAQMTELKIDPNIRDAGAVADYPRAASALAVSA